jgi:seryl-tRNA synthetase
MLDIQLLRKDLERTAARLATRGFVVPVDLYQDLEARRKTAQTAKEELQARRNALAKQIGAAKGRGEDVSALLEESAQLPLRLKQLEADDSQIQQQLNELLAGFPNLPHDSVPVGDDEAGNVEVSRWGQAREFDFEVADHVDVGTPLGLDFETGIKLSGARFTMMRSGIAQLHRAIAQLMLDVHTSEHGYTECYTPYIVNGATLYGTGQLPKFEADLFAVKKGGQEGDDEALYLIPTSEVSLTNSVRGDILEQSALPLRLTAHTPCFRSEAGSHGRDTRGMIRQHQFDKVEMVQITTPEQSYAALEQMRIHAETILQRLGTAVSRDGALHWRYGFYRRQDIRSGSLVAVTELLPRDFVTVELRGISGAPHANALSQGRWQAGTGAYPQWLGAGGGTHAGGNSRELSRS